MATTTRPTSHVSLASLAAPAIVSGVLMGAYLLLRPYGDAGDGPASAAAFASPLWVAAHCCGLLGLAAFAWLTLRLFDAAGGRLAGAARAFGLLGVLLVAPYYGAETFALHVLGSRATAEPGALAAVAGIATIRWPWPPSGWACWDWPSRGSWSRWPGSGSHPRCGWAAWPLGVAVALVLPQFYLPPVGRMAFGIAYAVAAAALAVAALRAGRVG